MILSTVTTKLYGNFILSAINPLKPGLQKLEAFDNLHKWSWDDLQETTKYDPDHSDIDFSPHASEYSQVIEEQTLHPPRFRECDLEFEMGWATTTDKDKLRAFYPVNIAGNPDEVQLHDEMAGSHYTLGFTPSEEGDDLLRYRDWVRDLRPLMAADLDDIGRMGKSVEET